MKKLVLVLFFICCGSIAMAGQKNPPSQSSNITMDVIAATQIQNTKLAAIGTKDVDERRGCCSHHGGVCGCQESSDRIICCDGTLSPSCRCSTY